MSSLDIGVQQIFLPLQNIQLFLLISFSLYVLIGITIVYLFYKKEKLNFIKFMIGGLALFALAETLKFFIGRDRPDLSSDDSFPSRHAVLAFFTAYFFPTDDKKLKILFYVWAILIGISRLALNVHWFTDVLAGAIIGIGFGWIIEKINLKKIKAFRAL